MKTLPPPVSEPAGNPSNQDQPADAGFSQVDLLAVLVVLVLLALLLTPALGRTRVTDQAFQCRNNLRQLLNGWRMYAADNSDRLTESMSWVNQSLSPSNPGNKSEIQQSLLWPYVKNLSTFQCPADESVLVNGIVGVGRGPKTRSYSMSQAIGTTNGGAGVFLPSPPWRVYGKLTDIAAPAPAGLWVFLDEHPDSINDGGFALSMSYAGASAEWVDVPGNYHEGACGFSFADGHTEMHKWVDERTIKLFPVTYVNSVPYSYRVPNSPDIAWVQTRTSAR